MPKSSAVRPIDIVGEKHDDVRTARVGCRLSACQEGSERQSAIQRGASDEETQHGNRIGNRHSSDETDMRWRSVATLTGGILATACAPILVRWSGVSGPASALYRLLFAALVIMPLWLVRRLAHTEQHGLGSSRRCPLGG